MARMVRKGEAFTWHHVVRPSHADRDFVADLFRMSSRDRELLSRVDDLPRFYERGTWHMLRLHVPSVHAAHSAYETLHVTLLFNKDTVVTMTDGRIASLERLMKEKKPSVLRSGAVGDVIAWLLGDVLDAMDPVLDALHLHIERLGETMRRLPGDRVTKQLGALRRDILHLDLMMQPGRAVIEELQDTRTPYRPPRVVAALRGICDRLQAMHMVLAHDGKLVDALFQEHESVLSHRTNQTVQVLTVMSVLLMPPTLVASYYGMNVAGLPWAYDVRLVTGVIVVAVVLFLLLVIRVVKK